MLAAHCARSRCWFRCCHRHTKIFAKSSTSEHKYNRRHSTTNPISPASEKIKQKFGQVPELKEFLSKNYESQNEVREVDDIVPPYLTNALSHRGRKVYFETYGCQMNVNDSEYAWAILKNKGYVKTDSINEADVIILVTCSIREKAEDRIWGRLGNLRELKRTSDKAGYPKIALLGCMAERLKKQIVEKEKAVDVIAGPDAYRDLPRLLEECSENSTTAINVMLSADETYADIMPVRFSEESRKAFVSIMRGCDNMCSYCIVPFTRGRERSRPVSSILEEVQILSDQGIKQVTLLGQNVNSYRDLSEVQHATATQSTVLSKGFKTIYKSKVGGLRFADLLDKVSLVDPEMRIRFTSPHPKDFPDEVLQVIKERNNICNFIHMPAQSGSSAVLEKMRRGYSREDYLKLAHRIREYIPGVCLSTDMIVGFCGETEADHDQSLSLMREVKYENAFLFAYSMRKKTHAYHRMQDDVSVDVKKRRLHDIIELYHNILRGILKQHVGQTQLMQVDGISKKSSSELVGRNDGNLKVIIPDIPLETLGSNGENSTPKSKLKIGDYVAVKIVESTGGSLRGKPIGLTTLNNFYRQTSLYSYDR